MTTPLITSSNDPSPEARDDETLVEAARAGDRRAYEELWQRYSKLALATIRPLAKADTEDVVAEAFIAIWEQLQRGVGPTDNFRGYLLVVVRNMSAKHYNERKHLLTNFEFETEIEDSPVQANDQVSANRQEHREIVQAFTQLPERWQQVLWLTSVDEVPRGDIAKQLGLTPNAVSAITVRAKEGLRIAWLQQHLPPHDLTEHPEIVGILPRYLRGSLSGSKTEQIREHLDACKVCEAQLAAIRLEDLRLGGKAASLALLGAALIAGGSTLNPIHQSTLAMPAPVDAILMSTEHVASTSLKMLATPVHPIKSFGLAAQQFFQHGATSVLLFGGAGLIATTAVLGSALTPEVSMAQPPAEVQSTQESLDQTSPSPADKPAESNSHETAEDEPIATAPQSVAPESGAVNNAQSVPVAGASTVGAPQPPSATTAPPTPEQPAEPAPPASPEEVTQQLTVFTTDERGGSIAPILRGTATQLTTVTANVSGSALTTQANERGEWVLDLAEVDLSEGNYRAEVTQSADDVQLVVQFSLSVPQAEMQSWPSTESSPAHVRQPFVVKFTGIPGADICPRTYMSMWNPITLVEDGTGTTPMFYAWPFSNFGYGYCDGERLGASGYLSTSQ